MPMVLSNTSTEVVPLTCYIDRKLYWEFNRSTRKGVKSVEIAVSNSTLVRSHQYC